MNDLAANCEILAAKMAKLIQYHQVWMRRWSYGLLYFFGVTCIRLIDLYGCESRAAAWTIAYVGINLFASTFYLFLFWREYRGWKLAREAYRHLAGLFGGYKSESAKEHHLDQAIAAIVRL